jgi:glutamate dehydrogenase
MPASADMRAEAQEFLRWAADNHFTFLGYREYEVCERDGKRVLASVPAPAWASCAARGRGEAAPAHRPGRRRPQARHQHRSADPDQDQLALDRASPGYMDYIGVLCFDDAGNAVAEQRFLGLYTSSAYNRRPWEIPLVRQRHAGVMEASGLGETSHSGKALRHILETLPRDELFQAGTEELTSTAMGILALQDRARTRLFLRRDRHGRFYSALVYIPRDRFTADVRERIEAMLMRELKGDRLDTSVQIGESPLAQLHLLIRPRAGESVLVDPALLEAELVHIVRNWQDQLRDHLVQVHGEEQGIRLGNRFGKALPAGYVESTSPEQAATDVGVAAALAGEQDLHRSLYHAADGGLRFKLIRPGKEIALSDALPMLENLGLRINSEHPYEIELDDGRVVIQDFAVEPLSRAGRRRGRARSLRGRLRRGVARRRRERRLQPPGAGGRPRLAPGRDAARLLQVPAADRRDLLAGLHGRDAGALPAGRATAGGACSRRASSRAATIKADPATCRALREDLTSIVPMADRAAMGTILEEMGADRALDREAQIDACGDALAITWKRCRASTRTASCAPSRR